MALAEIHDTMIPPREPALADITFDIVGERGPIFEAFAVAQGAFQPIERTKTVEVRSDRANYDFDYAPLDEVLRKTVPALSANGLAIWNQVGQRSGQTVVSCVLSHKSGSLIKASIAVPATKTWWKDGKEYTAPKTNQELASDITYWKRQLIIAQLGVCADADDDGAAGEQMTHKVTDRGPRENTQPRPPAPPKKEPVPAKKPAEQTRPALAAVKPPEEKAEQKPAMHEEPKPATVNELKALMREAGITGGPAIYAWSMEVIKKTASEMSEADAHKLIANLKERLAAKGETA